MLHFNVEIVVNVSVDLLIKFVECVTVFLRANLAAGVL